MEDRTIEDLLDKVGVPINLSGYKCWIEAIKLKLNDENISMEEIYRRVANESNSTRSRVERAMRHSRMRVFKENGYSYFKNISYELDNSSFLGLLAREMQR